MHILQNWMLSPLRQRLLLEVVDILYSIWICSNAFFDKLEAWTNSVLRIRDILGWIRIHGSMPLTNGSGSWIRILLFSSLTFKMPAKNKIFNTIFSAYDFLKLHLHYFSKIKIQKESQNRKNQGFSYYFCMTIEGSGSWRPKNTWIRIRIRNTGLISPLSTKAKCRRLKLLTCKGTLRQVFIRVYRQEIQSDMLVFSPSLVNCCSSNQCCGSGMFIPDPDFYPSRIPDLGSRIQNQQQKRGVKRNLLS
jgi:hypothetical protein